MLDRGNQGGRIMVPARVCDLFGHVLVFLVLPLVVLNLVLVPVLVPIYRAKLVQKWFNVSYPGSQAACNYTTSG
jgi:hypothetical protein